jgi:hypothetical protein
VIADQHFDRATLFSFTPAPPPAAPSSHLDPCRVMRNVVDLCAPLLTIEASTAASNGQRRLAEARCFCEKSHNPKSSGE